MSCPCCRDCLVFDYAIRDTLSAMPSMEDLENLNTPVPYELIDDDIDQLMREMDQSVKLVEKFLRDINYGLDGIKFGLRVILTFMLVASLRAELPHPNAFHIHTELPGG